MTTLLRWSPIPRADDGQADEEPAKGGMLAPANLDMIEKRDQVALHRAAKLNGIADRIFHPNPNFKHTPWYDEMERIASSGTVAGARQISEMPLRRRLRLDAPRNPRSGR